MVHHPAAALVVAAMLASCVGAPLPQAMLAVVDDRGAPIPSAWAEVEITVSSAGPFAQVGARIHADAGGCVRLPWLEPEYLFVLVGAPGRAYERIPFADADGSTVTLPVATPLHVRVVDAKDERAIPDVLVWPQELSARHAVTSNRDGVAVLVGLAASAAATSVVCVGSANRVVARTHSDRRGTDRTVRCDTVDVRQIRLVGIATTGAPGRDVLRLNQEGMTSEVGVDVLGGEVVVDAPFACGLLAIEGHGFARTVVDVEADHAQPQTVERADASCVGRVTVSGKPGNELLVTAFDDDGLLAWTTTDAQGRFRLAVTSKVVFLAVSGGAIAWTAVEVPASSSTGSRSIDINASPGVAARFAFQGVERVEAGNMALWRKGEGAWEFVFVRQLAGLRELRLGGLSDGSYRLVGDVAGRFFETEFTVNGTDDVRGSIALASR